MYIKVAQSSFLLALQIIQKGVSSQSTLPILTGIKISTEGKDTIILHTTDLEISIETKCKADVKNPGTTVITGKLLIEIVRRLPEGIVELNTEDYENNMTIKAEKASFKIRTLPPEDFPLFPIVEDSKKISINGLVLAEVIKQTGKVVSRDETRPVLTGAMLKIEGKNLIMAATDSYRLAIKIVPLKTKNNAKITAIIPLRALEEFQKTASQTTGNVDLITDENLLKLVSKETIIVTRLIEGQFPNYKQLIPEKTTLEVQAEKKAIIEAISRTALMAQKNMSIKIHVDGQSINIQAATHGVGEAKETVKVKAKGKEIGPMAFNAQYLLDGMSAINEENIKLQFTGAENPGLIRSTSTDDYLYLIMPIRIG